MHTIADRRLLMLRPGDIVISPARQSRRYDEYELKRLADCIASNGLVEPIPVRRANGAYELIAGERRLLAAKAAGLRRIPCVLHKADDITADFYSVIENLQRCTPDIFEEAQQIKQLLERYSITQTEAAIRLGITQYALASRLSLLNLDPALRHRMTDSGLTVKHARALLRLPQDKRSDALDAIIADGLTVRQTEELTERILHPADEPPPPPEPIRKMAVGDVRFFSNSLSKLVDKARSAGIPAQTRRNETDKYIEYKVRIKKEAAVSECQLHIR